MPQVINTNIASINAQRNLDGASGGLSVSLQRLSSGLRINSAKDDAAGLAIATRFTSRISGLQQASRNANDAISLSQVAEGALQETTNILQRSRELAIQAANGSNSAADRKALQAEVNQLKNELTRIATTTTFNGLNILNGELTNTAFQIGSEANQTVTVSISDTRTSAVGSNSVKTSNTNGLEQATNAGFIGGGTTTDDTGIGTSIGVTSADSLNGYVAETFTLTNTSSAGTTQTQTSTFTASQSADIIASSLSNMSGVSATAFNQVTITNLTLGASSDSFSLNLSLNGTAAPSSALTFASSTASFSTMASNINADTDYAAAGVYAIGTTSSLNIFAINGEDIMIENISSAGDETTDIASALRTDQGAGTGIVSATTTTMGGRLDITIDQGYTLTSNLTAILGSATPSAQSSGLADVSAGNVVVTQDLTLSGSTGSTTISITANDEASAIVTAVNNVTGSTNVKATAKTELTLRGLTSEVSGVSADGTVTFSLFGDNTTGASISAAITTNDFTALTKAINDASGNTGITAATDGANNIIKLTHSTGKDIKIESFTHSAAVDYQSASTTSGTIITGDGSSTVDGRAMYLEVVGNSAENTGATVRLYDGGVKTAQDSTVVGGQVSFTSSKSFSVSASVDGAGFTGGLFNAASNAGNSSTLTTVASVDISTAAGAQTAIDVLDEAINQVSEVRADLGAVQSRFESAIRNLSNNIENLNVARSRILDTDFAAETAALTKNQILSQAGISILSQANALPQNVLALLQ